MTAKTERGRSTSSDLSPPGHTAGPHTPASFALSVAVACGWKQPRPGLSAPLQEILEEDSEGPRGPQARRSLDPRMTSWSRLYLLFPMPACIELGCK